MSWRPFTQASEKSRPDHHLSVIRGWSNIKLQIAMQPDGPGQRVAARQTTMALVKRRIDRLPGVSRRLGDGARVAARPAAGSAVVRPRPKQDLGPNQTRQNPAMPPPAPPRGPTGPRATTPQPPRPPPASLLA